MIITSADIDKYEKTIIQKIRIKAYDDIKAIARLVFSPQNTFSSVSSSSVLNCSILCSKLTSFSCQIMKEDYSLALSLINVISQFISVNGDEIGLMDAYISRAMIYSAAGMKELYQTNFDEALKYYDKITNKHGFNFWMEADKINLYLAYGKREQADKMLESLSAVASVGEEQALVTDLLYALINETFIGYNFDLENSDIDTAADLVQKEVKKNSYVTSVVMAGMDVEIKFEQDGTTNIHVGNPGKYNLKKFKHGSINFWIPDTGMVYLDDRRTNVLNVVLEQKLGLFKNKYLRYIDFAFYNNRIELNSYWEGGYIKNSNEIVYLPKK